MLNDLKSEHRQEEKTGVLLDLRDEWLETRIHFLSYVRHRFSGLKIQGEALYWSGRMGQ